MNDRGFTLPQLLLSVSGLLALALVLPPVVAYSVNGARVARATRAAERIAAALAQATRDLGGEPRWVTEGDRTSGRQDLAARMLTGPGAVPKVTGNATWFTATSDTLTRQLVQNGPGYPTDRTGRGWRGPYLQPDAAPDPWGNQFIVWFNDAGGGFVLSAGTDGTVDTHVPDLRSLDDVVGDDVVVAVGR